MTETAAKPGGTTPAGTTNGRYDLIVIGGGPGGYVAALRAAQLGMSVAVVERDRLGGVCANQGCIPTKALLRSAEVWRLMQDAGDYGLSCGDLHFDVAAIAKRAAGVADRMKKGVEGLLRKAKVTVVKGEARLGGDSRTVIVKAPGGEETQLSATNIILATGARPRVLPGLESDGETVLTYREALAPATMPKSLLIVGAGAIGVEFASFYRAFGVAVTLVEAKDRILPLEDEEVSKAARRVFERQGMRIVTSAAVGALERVAKDVAVSIAAADKTERLTVERVLVAVGIDANIEGLGLEETRVEVRKGRVVVDAWCATAEPGLFAIGDMTGPPWLAHKASREALICVDHIAGIAGARPLDPSKVPACTYSLPQVASVGLTEADAVARGFSVKVGRSSFAANGKARAVGDTDGFVKTVFDSATGELLGAHLFGHEVTELVHAFALACTLEATDLELAETVYPHPTLSEASYESVLAAYGRAVHG